MPKDNTGKGFEKLTESIYNKLKNNSTFQSVEHNVLLNGADGKRQIDVLITGEIAGVNLKIIVECKDHNSKISVQLIDSFHSKLLDVNASKGILVSRRGFSKKAISKAKRLGISLCTAYEVLSEKWEPEIDIDILIEELKPTGFFFQMEGTFNDMETLKEQLFKINGINIAKLLNEKWRSNLLNYKKINGAQQIQLLEINKPYIITTLNDEWVGDLTNLKIYLELKIKHYKTRLKDLKGTQILENITDGKTDMFIELPSLGTFEDKLQLISPDNLKYFKGLTIFIRLKPRGNLELKDYEFNTK